MPTNQSHGLDAARCHGYMQLHARTCPFPRCCLSSPPHFSVVIKGREDEEAVLCTSRHTYAMKLVETTNLQLLVQPQPQGEAGQGHTGQQQVGRGAGGCPGLG